MMTTIRNHIRFAIAAAACLAALALLAAGGAAAWATVDVGAGGQNSLVVSVPASAGDDIAQADVQASVYLVAHAQPASGQDSYDYVFDIPDFASLGEGYRAADMNAARWSDLAERAVELAGAGTARPVASQVPVGEQMAGLADGLYLVLAQPALTQTTAYTFSPALVALPTKEPQQDAAGNLVAGTAAEYGPWLRDAALELKYEAAPLFGSLVIQKTVEDFAGEPATFVFRIWGDTPSGGAYENYAAVTMGAAGTASALVTRIPAGTQVQVQEVYAGPRYRLASAEEASALVASDEAVEAGQPQARVAFANAPTGSGVGGHGIQNTFELGEDGDWSWTASPAQEG